jgi:hypothetical protein
VVLCVFAILCAWLLCVLWCVCVCVCVCAFLTQNLDLAETPLLFYSDNQIVSPVRVVEGPSAQQ